MEISALLRLIILAGMGPLLTLHVVAPLWGTFIPLCRERRRVSWPLFWRLVSRLGTVLTNVFLIVFALEDIRPGTFISEFVLWVIAVSWLFIGMGD